MLIEFSVENFLSFREKQTFSMVAAPRLKKKENVFRPEVQGETLPELLKIAAIYGPNASGKSNLIKAFGLVHHLISRPPSTVDSALPATPFRFDAQLAEQPSRIELHFVAAEQRYTFELAFTRERINEERLTIFPKGKTTLLYERIHTLAGEQYTMGAALEGEKMLHLAWQKLTGKQTLFIAQAVANSSEDLQQLRAPFKWLQNGIFIVGDDIESFTTHVQILAQQHPVFASDISTFLQEIDVPVVDIQFKQLPSIADKKMILTHQTALGNAFFDVTEESKGTQNLIGFWLPWMLKNALTDTEKLQTLIVDELDSSLHPNIVANLIKKHQEEAQPTQLIFTTHDTHLMDTKLLRRDQFWLTERDANGATQLRSIHDFEGREGEDLEKRYYEGRYRGLPFIR